MEAASERYNDDESTDMNQAGESTRRNNIFMAPCHSPHSLLGRDAQAHQVSIPEAVSVLVDGST